MLRNTPHIGFLLGVTSLLALLAAFPPSVEGRYIVVGDTVNYTNSWNEDYNYTQWMIDNPLYVGDIAVFMYPPSFHVVWELPDLAAYDACDYSSSFVLAGETDATWPRGYFMNITSKPAYIACGINGHCEMGQKVILNGSLGPLPKSLASSSSPGNYTHLPPGTKLNDPSPPPPPESNPPPLLLESKSPPLSLPESDSSPPPPTLDTKAQAPPTEKSGVLRLIPTLNLETIFFAGFTFFALNRIL